MWIFSAIANAVGRNFIGSPNYLYDLIFNRAKADGGVTEAQQCTIDQISYIDKVGLISQASLLLTPTSYKEGKLYADLPINGNGDFTATRATTATRVNAAGLVDLVPYNLLTYSEMFSDASWLKSETAISANVTTAPNGTLTADKFIPSANNATHQIRQTGFTSSAYSFSIYAKAGEETTFSLWLRSASVFVVFDLSNGTITSQSGSVTATITSVGDGWYRCTAYDPTPGTTAQIYARSGGAFAGNGTNGFFLWGAQLVEGTSARDYLRTETRLNIPRVDYSLGGCPNILLEPQRTNLNTFSEEFNNNTFWLRGTGVGVNANTSTSPSGTLTADTITGATGPFVWTGPGTFFRAYVALTSSTAYTFSTYLKGTGSVTMTWRDGTTGGVNSLVCNLTSSWQRFEITRATGGATVSMAIVFHSATGNFDAWGGQMELGAYATSFIPTTTASVTRNADTITRNNIFTNGLITAAGGTWFVELRGNVAIQRDSATQGIFINTGTSATIGNGITIRNLGGLVRNSIVKIISGTATTIYTTTSNTCKIAIKWNGTTADVFENGVKVVSATSFTPTAMQNLIGDGSALTLNLNETALFPTPLTDAQMSMLTSDIYPTAAAAYASLGLVSESPSCLTSTTTF